MSGEGTAKHRQGANDNGRGTTSPRAEASGSWGHAIPGLVFCVSLVVYVWSLCPTLYWGDGGGWIAASVTIGVPPSSGCPSYLMFGRLFSHLPFGDLPFRFNLLSAVCGAACVALAFCLVRRVVCEAFGASRRRSIALALAGAGVVAFCGEVWLQSVTAELYLPVAALTLAAWVCVDSAARNGEARFVLAGALMIGLALAVHPSALFALPAIAGRLWQGRRELPVGRLCAWSVPFAAGGLALYLYLPLVAAKDPVINWGNPDTVGRFWQAVSGGDFASLKAWPSLTDLGWRLVEVAYLTRDSVSLLVLLLGTVGLAMRGTRLVPLMLLGAGNVAMVCVYGTSETGSYLALPQMVWGIFAAIGTGWVAERLLGRRHLLRARTATVLACAIGAAAVAANAMHNLRTSPKRGETSGRNLPEALLAALPEGSIFLCEHSGVHLAVDYLQWAEGKRRDILNVYTPLAGRKWVREELKKRDPLLAWPVGSANAVVGLVRANDSRRCMYLLPDATGPLTGTQNWPLGPVFVVQVEDRPGVADHCVAARQALGGWESLLEASTDEVVREFRANVHLNLARHAHSQGRLRQAMAHCARAVEVAPKEAAPWASLGELLRSVGQIERGEEMLQRAKELAPWQFAER